MTYPCIDRSIEGSLIDKGITSMGESDISSFETEDFYVSDTVSPSCTYITRELTRWDSRIWLVGPSEHDSLFGEGIIKVELWCRS
jgi:hypothetical protein